MAPTNAPVKYATPYAAQGKRLKVARAKAKLGGVNAAARLYGINARHLIKLENGQHRPGAVILARIAAVTGNDVEHFGYPDPDDEEEAQVSLAELLLQMAALVREHEAARV